MDTSPLSQLRRWLATTVRERVAGDDFAAVHADIWYGEGPRRFTADDPIWQVHADTAMFVGGLRALLLQALHPVAMAAVARHSGYRSDPWGRLQRTSHFLAATTYGSTELAAESIERVRRIHARIRGTTADGVAYRADDPDLLAWVHLAEVDSFVAAHRAFGAEPLTDVGYDEYVSQAGEASSGLGVVTPPRSVAEVAVGLETFRPLLTGSRAADEVVDLVVRRPPLPAPAVPGYLVLVAGAVSLLPPWARRDLRLPTLPITDRLVSRPLTRTALHTLRWALASATDEGTAV